MTTSSRIRIIPYKSYSRSAKVLSRALGGKLLRLVDSKFKPKPQDVIINWGNSLAYEYIGTSEYTFNCVHENDLNRVRNKLLFFKEHEDQPWLPSFWVNKDDIPDDAFPIVCRTILSGHSGDGIHIAETREQLIDAPLYVKYEKKKEEYRIHVGRNPAFNHWQRPCLINCSGGCSTCAPDEHGIPETVTIAIQQKKRRLNHDQPNWQVRNHSNGFIYARSELEVPQRCIDAARDCFERSGIDFGAVDVIWNAKKKQAYVLEINTAPGLEGSTVSDYANYFKKFIG